MGHDNIIDRQQPSDPLSLQQQAPSSQTHKLVRNAFFNSFSWLASVFVNVATIPIFVSYLGMEGYGIYALLTGLFGYFSLIDLGMGQGIVKYVAQFSGSNDHNSMSHLVNASLIVQLGFGSLGVALLWVFNDGVIRLLNVSPAFYAEARTGLYVSSFGFLVTMLMANYSNALQGLQRYDLVGKANLIFSVLTTLATIIALMLGAGLAAIICVSLAGTIITFFVFFILFKRAFPKYRFSWRIPISHLKMLTTFGNYILAGRVAYVLNTYFVRYIIAFFVGPAAVTLLVVPTKLLSFLQGGIGSVAAVILPFASVEASLGRESEFRQMYLRASKILTCLTLPLFLFSIVYAKEILTIWMGHEFANDAWIVQVVVGLTFLFSAFTIIPTNAILGLGEARVVAYFALGTTIVNVALCSFLTSAFGVIGAATAVLGTQLFAFPFVWFVTTRTLSIPWRRYLRESIRPGAALSIWYLALTIVSSVLLAVLNWNGTVLPLVFGILLLIAYFVLAQKRGLVPISIIAKSIGRP